MAAAVGEHFLDLDLIERLHGKGRLPAFHFDFPQQLGERIADFADLRAPLRRRAGLGPGVMVQGFPRFSLTTAESSANMASFGVSFRM